MNALITTFGLTIAVAATTVGASAQTTQPSATTAAVSTSSSTQAALSTQASNQYTEQGYQNADPLHGIYMSRPLIPECGSIEVGPMAVAASGSVQAAPLANFLTDFDMPGVNCRYKGI